jgi:hypothetical protein
MDNSKMNKKIYDKDVNCIEEDKAVDLWQAFVV